ncbi:MAG: hypothetical protein M3Q48_16755 [Actinomycetota bacterium]|nr:hypothetical protein [Actinomycetota bacterium]HSH23304.1 hypothetical protein [Acidimicrobiales bacterium]
MTSKVAVSALRPPAAVVLCVLLAAGGGACSGDGDGTAASATSTTVTAVSFEERDQAIQLNLAATGVNLVAGDVGLRAARGDGAEYCRSSAPSELAPHQSVLEAAADPEVRRLSQDALAELGKAIELCAGGAEAAAVQRAIAGYNARFERLQHRIEALGGSRR